MPGSKPWQASQSQGQGSAQSQTELEANFPEQPINRGTTFPFHFLYDHLFQPLLDNRTRGRGPAVARRKVGPNGNKPQNPNEKRKDIIVAFITKWRNEVGDDIYPAFRLIMPDKDRDRAMYGLKEATIAKLLIKLVKIDPDSEAALNLKNWKSAGARTTSSAGDFAGRCFDLLNQGRAILAGDSGDLTIEQVNEMLDRLSVASKEDQQLLIMQEFYRRMNAMELMWLIRIILRQMKIGATEKTFLDTWHPDAETLFNVSSNLRRVCWELTNPKIRLEAQDADICLMSCFQPQLAAFQMHDLTKMVQKMRLIDEKDVFWVEEKLDGERMQLHMKEDPGREGGKKFKFWSRKAKEYTYLYGDGLFAEESSITRYLRDAFHDNVRNLILDGEMITWNMKHSRIEPFGTLKTAALDQKKNPSSITETRPVFKVFDILYLNDMSLTKYTLEDRRKALVSTVKSVELRLEIHGYTEGKTAADIEPLLREVIAKGSEGLVLKNPRSAYHVNDRNDDWNKVKPEYMTGYGEELDCVVIGGYYGSGHRGGILSSFLCGLRTTEAWIRGGDDVQKCYSFFKVGGGFTMSDYMQIEDATKGKWKDWDSKNPPSKYIELGGKERGLQLERPDVWIKPEDSVVLEVKAAQITGSPQFATYHTLRFPRFKKLRSDKDWKSALSIDEFLEMQHKIKEDKELKMDKSRVEKRRKAAGPGLREKVVLGAETQNIPQFAPGASTKVFTGLHIFILCGTLKPNTRTDDKTKQSIEQLVKHHGANITQDATSNDETICIAERETVSVRGVKMLGTKSIIRPSWLFDCIKQAEIDAQLGRPPLLLPYEPDHVYSAKVGDEDLLAQGVEFVTGGLGIAVDVYGDSFARDIESVEEMRRLFDGMPAKFEDKFDAAEFKAEMREHNLEMGGIFAGLVIYFDQPADVRTTNESTTIKEFSVDLAKQKVRLAGGTISETLDDNDVTSIVVIDESESRVKSLRKTISTRRRLPHLVGITWIDKCWEEGTLLDEGKFAPSG